MLSLNALMLLLSMPGGTEWILIILAVLILFGGRKIPEFMRGLGRGIREFNDAKTNVNSISVVEVRHGTRNMSEVWERRDRKLSV